MIKIALDMDSVLADIAPVECQIIEEVTGKKIGKLHLKQRDWLDLYDLRKDISLDNSPVNAEEAVKSGKPLFLYTQPWNMGHDYPFPVERIFSLSDARRLLRTNRI